MAAGGLRLVYFLLLGTAAGLLAALGGCGGKGGGSTVPPEFNNADLQAVAHSIEGEIAEIDAAPLPAGVDPRVFEQLKAELKRVLQARGNSQLPITPPMGAGNKVTDLRLFVPEYYQPYLSWSYQNLGDYNQDKLVSVNDLTPIGIHFGKSSLASDWREASTADGNGDGMITVSDISPIGQHFNSQLAGYYLQHADSEDGPWTTIDTVDFNAAVGPSRKQFTYVLRELEDGYFRVEPSDGTSTGEPSNVAHFEATGVEPQITSVSSGAGEAGTMLTLSATVTGSEPLAYSWDFGGGAIPNYSPAVSPTVSLAAVGGYSARLTVANAFSEDSYDFALLVIEPGGLDDTILAIPHTFDADPYEPILVSVECFNTASPFYELSGVRVTFDESHYLSGLNAGAPGGEADDADGAVWGNIYGMEPLSLVSLSLSGIDLGNGRRAVDVRLEPDGGEQIDNATGELFNFVLYLSSQAMDGEQLTIGLERLDAEAVSRTFYTESSGSEHYWSNDDNSSVPPISVSVPTFELLDPPEIGDGSPLDPYIMSAGRQYHFQVHSAGAGDLTTDPRTVYTLAPLDCGTLKRGVLTIASDFLGVAAARIQYENYESPWWYFKSVDFYDLPPDSIVAIPTRTEAHKGEHVGVLVYINETTNPFRYVNAIGITLEAGNSYVTESFSSGDPGGGHWPGADGVWATMIPPSSPGFGDFRGRDAGDGLIRFDVNFTPSPGDDLLNATGALCYFEIEIGSDLTLGFQEFNQVKRTYYSDNSLNEYYWGDSSNNHAGVPNSITMLPSF
jgi:hypothetical protein